MVHFYVYSVGSADFLYSFFSTVAVRLEDEKWGSVYPVIMNELYQGELSADNVSAAITELTDITERLKAISPDKVIWDYDDRSKLPPWGDNISPDISNLSDYFITSDGANFLTVFLHALQAAQKLNKPLKISTM